LVLVYHDGSVLVTHGSTEVCKLAVCVCVGGGRNCVVFVYATRMNSQSSFYPLVSLLALCFFYLFHHLPFCPLSRPSLPLSAFSLPLSVSVSLFLSYFLLVSLYLFSLFCTDGSRSAHQDGANRRSGVRYSAQLCSRRRDCHRQGTNEWGQIIVDECICIFDAAPSEDHVNICMCGVPCV
jgi:hypothetical protein